MAKSGPVVVLARRLQPVRKKVVFMGMGEPSHNLANVLEAIEFLGSEGGLAHKQLVFSTVGDERAFEALHAAPVKAGTGAIPAHHRPELRAIAARAPRLTPQRLVELADAYARATGYPIQYQWTLLRGVNDSAEGWTPWSACWPGAMACSTSSSTTRWMACPLTALTRRPDAGPCPDPTRRADRCATLAGRDVEWLRPACVPARPSAALAPSTPMTQPINFQPRP